MTLICAIETIQMRGMKEHRADRLEYLLNSAIPYFQIVFNFMYSLHATPPIQHVVLSVFSHCHSNLLNNSVPCLER